MATMGSQPHLLVVPFPAQGHVVPLMKLSHKIAAKGIKVTFVNTESNHAQVIGSMSNKGKENCPIQLVSIPDGLENPGDSNQNLAMDELENLIEIINCSGNNEPVTCIMVDALLGWILGIAEKRGLKQVAIWSAGPGSLVLVLNISKLIESGVVDIDGKTVRSELIQLSKEIPAWSSNEFSWSCPDDPILQKYLFDVCCQTVNPTVENSNWLLCNTFYELDSHGCDLIPKLQPIGPLSGSHSNYSTGSMFLEDSESVRWLDKQQPDSVVYVSFGSTKKLGQQQFNELAHGLELLCRPFLWVVRSDMKHENETLPEYPDGFLETVANRGKIVKLAPQEEVLAHPSTACFVSHCGWNSTMEGLTSGVPFICWPHFLDQYHNRDYICDIWKVGFKLDTDENGIVSRNEIKTKIENLLSDDSIKSNALKLREMASKSVNKGGSSYKNFEKLMDHLKN